MSKAQSVNPALFRYIWAKLAVLISWQIQNGSHGFDFSRFAGLRPFILSGKVEIKALHLMPPIYTVFTAQYLEYLGDCKDCKHPGFHIMLGTFI